MDIHAKINVRMQKLTRKYVYCIINDNPIHETMKLPRFVRSLGFDNTAYDFRK